MKTRVGSILFWWVMLTLVAYLLFYGDSGQPLQFMQDALRNFGTTAQSAFIFMEVFGLVGITFLDAVGNVD